MKKTFILLNVLILVAMLSTSCLATEFNHTTVPNLNTVGDDVMAINEDESVTNSVENPYTDLDVKEEILINEDDLYEIQDIIDHDGLTLDGNAYFIGETVSLKNSMINGNAFILAEKVELDNVEVYGSLYLFSLETAKLKVTTLDVYAAAGTEIEIQKGSSILRGVRIASENIEIAGNIEKNCYLIGESINLDSAIILGNLNYSSSEEIDTSKASVGGNVNFTKTEDSSESAEEVEKTFSDYFTAGNIFSIILSTFIIAGLILLTSDKFVDVNRETKIGSTLGNSLIIGILALIVIPIISIFIMLTILGFGVGLFVLIVYLLILLNAVPIVSLVVSLAILKNKQCTNKWITLGVAIVVSIVITILKSIPVIRGLVGFLVCVVGLGIVIKTMFNKKKDNEKVQVIDNNM